MITFLYCIDENYNPQALASINSLLQKVSEQINIVIIHKNPDSFSNYKKAITKSPSLKNIKIIKFVNKDYIFPEVDNSHVSEATYYRLFLSEILDDQIQNLIYIDADVICINNPIPALYDTFRKFKVSNFTIGAKTTDKYGEIEGNTLFERLGIFNSYFNAGVMLINFDHWKNKHTTSELLKTLDEIHSKIQYWDQDVLNKYFDGKYYELDSNLNFLLNVNYEYSNNDLINIEKNTIFLHYVGSTKPWSIEGVFKNTSNYYQESYRSIAQETYHIETAWRTNDIKLLISNIINLKIFSLKKPIGLVYSFIKKLRIKE